MSDSREAYDRLVEHWERDIAALDRAIARAETAEAENDRLRASRPQWQPIETYVPKEGETILLSDGKIVGEAYWADNEGMFYWANTSVGDYVSGEARGMTHWQPLPAPSDGGER